MAVHFLEEEAETTEAMVPAMVETDERGRDLFWIHGWNKGFNWVEEQIKELHHWKEIKQQKAERRAREKASELPFDEDFEDEE